MATTTPTTTETAGARRPLRRGGIALLIAAATILITPVTVFLVPWSAIDPAYDDPTSWRDPLLTGALSWVGPIYGVQYLVLAAAIVFGAVVLRGIAGPTGTAAAFAASALVLVFGGSSAAWYSDTVTPALSTVQDDGAIRKVAGFADILDTQGLMGAIGILVMFWLLAAALGGRRAALYGRGPAIVMGVFSVLAGALYVMGRGAGAGLIMFVPLAVIGVWLLVAARRAADVVRTAPVSAG